LKSEQRATAHAGAFSWLFGEQFKLF
jgi:hypothetical protein